ncbi:histidine kinase [Pontibacter liquoris]|uniref:histidine kinase n=1 Tax=Pontibacter liquoris TaxID=2905677 RepID=UPI001FA6F7DE|nr:histidine kinase [Pontibacter liquoris]
MNIAQVDIQQLRIKHILYKSKVRSVLYGGVYDAAFFSHSGPVDTWFSTIGRVRYSQEPEMDALLKVHQELDITVNQLFGLYKGGKIEEAHEQLKSVEKSSTHFLSLLQQLEARLKVLA